MRFDIIPFVSISSRSIKKKVFFQPQLVLWAVRTLNSISHFWNKILNEHPMWGNKRQLQRNKTETTVAVSFLYTYRCRHTVSASIRVRQCYQAYVRHVHQTLSLSPPLQSCKTLVSRTIQCHVLKVQHIKHNIIVTMQ